MATETSTQQLSIIGVPMDLGADNLGVSMGPDALRFQEIAAKLQSTGFTVTDHGNVSIKPRAEVALGDNPKLRRLDEIVRVSEQTAALVDQAVQNGEKAVVLGGDHAICLGAVSGASAAVNGKLGLIYFDAHGDMNTEITTPTGNIHGMHLAALIGLGAAQLEHVYRPTTKVQKEHLLHIGGSDFDAGELELIAKENLQAFTLFDLLTSNLAPLFKMIDHLASQVDNIWISIDLDAIDEIYAPGAGMPNRKGLTYREISTIAKYIGERCNVIGIDVVEYNPLQDIQSKTGELAIELIATLLGRQYNWYSNYLAHNKN